MNIINYDDFIDKSNEKYRIEDIKGCHRTLICGASGSGKTNILLNLIIKNLYYNNIFIFSKSLKSDKKYEILRVYFDEIKKKVDKLNKTNAEDIKEGIKDKIEFNYDLTDDVSKMPNIETLNKKLYNLFIFDDGVIEMQNNKSFSSYIKTLYTRGRHLNLSTIFISQKYDTFIPTIVRENCTHLIMFGANQPMTTINSLRSILPYEFNDIRNLFKKNLSNSHEFILININAPEHKKFKKNLNEYINILNVDDDVIDV